ncbi:MAG: protease modulator HflC [Mariprofundales bacterium]
MTNKLLFIGAIIAFLLSLTAFVVDERQQAMVLKFGKPQKVIQDTGLHFKLPWENVKLFDSRLLVSDSAPNEVITKDKKSIIVDNYTRWRILDPLLVYQNARDEDGIAMRMEDVVRGKVRELLGQHTLAEIVSGGEQENLRVKLMQSIQKRANEAVKEFGIEVVDVRIKRAELPQENSEAVFQRMKAERQRKAKEYRSEGEEVAREIRAEADKERKTLVAEADKKAEIIHGSADAEAIKIYLSAHTQDPEFYAFMRSLEAYRNSVGENTRIILSPDSEFFSFFNQSK